MLELSISQATARSAPDREKEINTLVSVPARTTFTVAGFCWLYLFHHRIINYTWPLLKKDDKIH